MEPTNSMNDVVSMIEQYAMSRPQSLDVSFEINCRCRERMCDTNDRVRTALGNMSVPERAVFAQRIIQILRRRREDELRRMAELIIGSRPTTENCLAAISAMLAKPLSATLTGDGKEFRIWYERPEAWQLGFGHVESSGSRLILDCRGDFGIVKKLVRETMEGLEEKRLEKGIALWDLQSA